MCPGSERRPLTALGMTFSARVRRTRLSFSHEPFVAARQQANLRGPVVGAAVPCFRVSRGMSPVRVRRAVPFA
jgi:hypothetical protein